jgi:undecaprenyl-diphosphatase
VTPLQAIVLAVIQGISEFLPISSSGHLILVPRLLGWPDQGLVFDIATHVGSLLAVLVYFRKQLLDLVRAVPRLFTREALQPGTDAFMLLGLGIGTIPAAITGLLISDFVSDRARNVTLVATNLIVFGILLGIADLIGKKRRELKDVSWRHVGIVGCLQALALIPGTSRSGITITGGLFTGLTRPAAASFAFLLYVPVMLAVTVKEIIDLAQGAGAGIGATPLALGFVVSALTSFAVIAFLLRWLQRRSLLVFVVYRVLLGVVLLVWFA